LTALYPRNGEDGVLLFGEVGIGHALDSLASLVGRERLLLRTLRPNILIVGSPEQIETTSAILIAEVLKPVRYWTADARPPTRTDAATIMIHDIANMSPTHQETLLAWMDGPSAHDTQFIATSVIAVFPLVTQELFLEDLYYRLNTILLDLTVSF
jgi:hypothetical protein